MLFDDMASIGGWYRAGWRAFTAQPWPLLGGFLIFALIWVAFRLLAARTGHEDLIAFTAQLLITAPFVVGWASMNLGALRGQSVRAIDVFDGFQTFGDAVIANVLFTLAVGVGLLLFVVPGVIVMLVFGFWAFGVAEHRMRHVDALRYSRDLTRGFRWHLLGAGALALLLMIAAAIPAFLGALLVGPWLGATFAAAYESLVKASITSNADVIVEESDPNSRNE